MSDHRNTFDKKILQGAFNKAAKTYAGSAVLAKAVAEELVDRLQYMKVSPRTILEVGSGAGFVAQALAKTRLAKAYTIHLDFAIDLLRQATLNKKTVHVCADTYKLPFKTHSMDVLLSNLCLPFVDDIYAVLDEWQRVLKPGGLCLFTTLGSDTLKELKQAFAAVSQYSHVHTFLDMHNVGDALLATKFAEPVMDVDVVTMHYNSVDELLVSLKNQGVLNASSQRPRGLMTPRVLARMKQAYELSAGRCPATVEIVYGCAWATDVIPNKRVGNEVHVPMDILTRKR